MKAENGFCGEVEHVGSGAWLFLSRHVSGPKVEEVLVDQITEDIPK